MSAELIYITENLKEILAIKPQMKDSVREGIEHFTNEYKRVSTTIDTKSVAQGFNIAIQKQVDDGIAELPQKISCKNGCGFCCHINVDITLDEAELLLERAKEINYPIDWKMIDAQAQVGSENWKYLVPKQKKCVFLNEANSCSVYEYRPASCRKHMVLSDPKMCDGEVNPTGKILKVTNTYAEIIATGILNACESGSMGAMLLKAKNNLK